MQGLSVYDLHGITSLSLSLSMYTYICVCICMFIFLYIYMNMMYIHVLQSLFDIDRYTFKDIDQ